MSYPDLSGNSKHEGGNEAVRSAEETLRLVARLPAPEGLAERVQGRLRAAPRMGRMLAWPSSRSGGWLRTAAAAAIVFVVAGGGWGIYSRVQPGQPAKGLGGPSMAAPGGFTEGGAVRRPQTLVGPVVAVPAVTNPAVKAPAADAATPKTKAAGTVTPTKHSATANKVITQPTAVAVQ